VKTFSPILGEYHRINLYRHRVDHCGRTNVPIAWINEYTFYFFWDNKNEQIWTFDKERNCLHQICNKVVSDTCQHCDQKKSALVDPKNEPLVTGNFRTTEGSSIDIHGNIADHAGHKLNVIWLNPLTFYFKVNKGNDQILTYDPNSSGGYLQIGSIDGAVRDAFSRVDSRTYTRANWNKIKIISYLRSDSWNSLPGSKCSGLNW